MYAIRSYYGIDRARVEKELAGAPGWVLVRPESGTPVLLPAVDLVRALHEAPEQSYNFV